MNRAESFAAGLMAKERDEARVLADRLAAELAECAAVLPGAYYMDPPDGGDVSVSEQLSRMAKDAERYRLLRRKFAIISDVEGHAEFCAINLPRPTYIAPSSAIELDTALDRERLGLDGVRPLDEALGIDDDGCNEPEQTIFAIHEMKKRISELEAALASISEEMGLPPTIGPAPGALKKLLDDGLAAAKRVGELEAALKSASPVYRKPSDIAVTRGHALSGELLYYKIEPHIVHKALEGKV